MKRIISIIVLAVMFTAVSTAQVLTPWDGTVGTSLGSGEGTEASPYLITDASQLAYMASQIYNANGKWYEGIYFRLENDLDLGGALSTPSEWNPIGGNGKAGRVFYGIFDGNNKAIYNIYINKPAVDYIGLFGYIYSTAVVKNLTIASGTISGGQSTAGITGFSYGKVENCVNHAEITGKGKTGISYAGGIVGNNLGRIFNCYNTGTIKGNSNAGGIAGKHSKSTIAIAKIENCFNLGDVYTKSGNVGGIISEIGSADATMSNCYNFGDATNESSKNGTRCGGLVGYISVGTTVTSCYSTGNVVGGMKVGGLVGEKTETADVTNCYYDKQMCAAGSAFGGASDSDNAKGLLTKDMIKSVGLAGLSLDSWTFMENMYPRLKAFETNKTANVYAVPIILASTSETKYDTRCAVKNNFTVSAAISSTWSIKEGASVTLNQTTATVVRPDNGDDNVILEVTTNGVSRDLKIVVYQKPVTVTIVQPDNGVIKVMDGNMELVSPAAVESNTLLKLVAIPNDSDLYMLDTFLIDGSPIEGDKITITESTTISAKFVEVLPPGPWDGTIATEFGGGSGKDIAPYLIKSANQLAFLAQQVNSGITNYQGVYFKLVYNLNMGGDANNWIPIGKRDVNSEDTSFMGYFDGNGKEIRNLYIDAKDVADVGLFGQAGLGSEIKNLGLAADCNIKAHSELLESLQNTGGIIGSTRGPLINCWNKGSVSGTGNVGGIFGDGREAVGCYNAGMVTSATGHAGGIAAMTMVATLTDCYNSGKVTSNETAGGIIGFGNSSTFIGCYNTGEIVGVSNATGGIAGMIGGSTRISEIRGCANFGLVSTTSTTAGGIVGNVSNGYVSDCYNAGVVSGKAYLGGIAGRYNGLMGAISGCYSIGAIIGTPGDPNIGGILGCLDSGGFINNYYDKQMMPIEKAVGNKIDAENRRGVITSFLTVGTAIEGYDVKYWTFIEGLYPQLTKFKDLEYSKLNASTATLHAVSETNFETVKAVRTNFTVNTANAVVWTVETGTTIDIAGTVVTVKPRADADEQVTIKATVGGLSKTVTMTVPKLAYTLVIEPSINGSVIVNNATGESIASGTEIAPNQVITLTPIADEGYHFTKWWDNDVTNPRTITVNSSLAISASFEINSYTLAATAGANGEITPEGVTTVNFGDNQTYTIMPNVGYITETLLVDGASVAVVNNYTFNHIAANHTISATFKIKSYTITATAGENGTITPNGATMVEHGTNKTYTIAANAGYKIAKLTVDGATVPTAATYTFNSVVSDHTIDVTFEKQLFVITASSNEFGTISPIGKVEVVIGEDKEFFMIPNDGYSLKDVLVDEVSVLKDVVNSRYTFNAVNANHTIHVIFGDVVGVNTLEDSQISIWSNRTTVYLRSNYNNELNVEVIDVTGKTVSRTSFTTQTEIQINNKGIYIIRIADGSVVKSVRKVVLN